MEQEVFFDIHTHVMRLADADLANLLGGLYKEVGDLLGGNPLPLGPAPSAESLRSFEFIEFFLNTLSVMERPILEIMELMERDLGGGFGGRSFLDGDGRFLFKGRRYSKVGLGIQVMDFTRLPSLEGRLWYDGPSQDRIGALADATLEAAAAYRARHPGGLLELFPFLGVNPAAHPAAFIERLLEERFPQGGGGFYGLKLYPPLGMDPWPAQDAGELEKVRLVYGFCASRRIPIVTHCDNQGFRAVPPRTAAAYSSPVSWRPVLEAYPDLVVDFAHFGYQYGLPAYVQSKLPLSLPMQGQWFDEIVGLMERYPGVYADLSWTGSVPSFYKRLALFLEGLDEERRALVSGRIMFGTDFAISLLAAPSYNEQFSRFEEAPFTEAETEGFGQKNPRRFLGL